MWRIFQAPLHFLKLIVKQKPLCKVNEITFLCSYSLPHPLAVFFLLHLFVPPQNLNTWNRLQKHPYNLPTFLTLFIVNASKHVMCHIKQCPHQTAPLKSTPRKISNAACLIRAGNNLTDVKYQ